MSQTQLLPSSGAGAEGAPRQRKSFSLTRARPSRGRLTAMDRLRAAVFGSLAGAALRAVGAAMRMRTTGEGVLADHRRLGPGPLLFALWHGDYFPFMHYGRRAGVCVFVSRSPDGEILARLLRRQGYAPVRGSTSRGGVRAMIDAARLVASGHDAAIAVDGPRGPALRVKPGIIHLARLTGCPIVPIVAAFSGAKEFHSWDRFKIPRPFSTVLLASADPLLVPRDASDELMEERRRELERAMLALSRQTARRLREEPFESFPRPRGLK